MLIKTLFLFHTVFLLATGNPYEIWQNNHAVDQFNQKKVIEAHNQFTQLLSEKPFHPLYQFNLGASFLGVEEVKKAVKMYKEVLKLTPLPPELEFTANFNLGVLYATKDLFNLDKALSYYQKALELQPESKEVKTNIELLFKGDGGGGKGKKDQKDKKNKDKDEQQEPKEYQDPSKQPKPKPKPEMSKRDVKKILGEIKKQEQRIRAKHERKGKKREANREKSW